LSCPRHEKRHAGDILRRFIHDEKGHSKVGKALCRDLYTSFHGRAGKPTAQPGAMPVSPNGVKLQSALFPDGLPYSSKYDFFEPGKSPLINQFVDMLKDLCHVGVPDRI
jgi:hypothetical protein